jgi:hypothetical protein
MWSSGPGGAGSGKGGAGAGENASCAGVTAEAELVPLDMYIMLDRSGSMASQTASGPTKWQAITQALGEFFVVSAENGISVGLQFFPLDIPGTPDTCTTHAQCGAAGPCLISACDGVSFVLPCKSDADCGPSSGHCATLGVCANAPGYVCFYNHPSIPGDCGWASGSYLGTCQPMASSTCANPVSCSAADYASPAVEISPLTTGATQLMTAISTTGPDGMTPTAPAVKGLISHVQAWAAAHPNRRAVAVLATDGMPTQCNPQDTASIAQIAQAGMDGATPVQTFVIGVFSPSDAGAQQNLDTIAQAGGTESAFFITVDQDVAQAFLGALKAIQNKSLDCEYQVPNPPAGEDLAYDEVNVEHTPENQSEAHTIPYVAAESACDGADGGWYYDKDPAKGQAPAKIVMCPATCSTLQGAGGKLSIRLGCKTVVPEPK